MSNNTEALSNRKLKVSEMAENLIGSEIIKLAGEIRDKIAKGDNVYNFTIGDFDPAIFPIPVELRDHIIACYMEGLTNYPVANGNPELRKQISRLINRTTGVDYSADEILVAGGARPVIYAIFQALLDPGDKVVFPVPSWNNNHYTHLSHAVQVMLPTLPENNFLPTADELRPHLRGASLLALCSPLNPTGTSFKKDQLEAICDLVIEENALRGADEKPLYLMYDQIYNLLTFGGTQHFHPVQLRPEIRPYTLYVDGISKSLASTGVRVGWAFGPERIIEKMKSILGHVGAWSPRPEQIATGRYLANDTQVDTYLAWINSEVEQRLTGFYNGIVSLKNEGFSVDAIAPQAAIYLTVKIDLVGKVKEDGTAINSVEDTTAYILNEAKMGIVPFSAFGSSKEEPWYRISVGTASLQDVAQSIVSLRSALAKLK